MITFLEAGKDCSLQDYVANRAVRLRSSFQFVVGEYCTMMVGFQSPASYEAASKPVRIDGHWLSPAALLVRFTLMDDDLFRSELTTTQWLVDGYIDYFEGANMVDEQGKGCDIAQAYFLSPAQLMLHGEHE